MPEASIPPEAMIHFPPFQIPPVSENFSDSVENFPNCTFSRKFFRFSSTKILLFPYLSKFPLFLANLRAFYTFYVFFVLPTFTMMHLCSSITQCTYWTPLPFACLLVHGSSLHFIQGRPVRVKHDE